jgi:hypothetical protein
MRERLRSFDSKITFFAFADIITAVSGMLIFITLLLATDLGRPTDSRSEAANSETQKRLEETLAQQVVVDAQNRSLEQLLAAAETAPAAEKLEADITRLRAQLAEEKKKHASVAEQLAASQSAVEARDRTLGLTDLKAQIQQTIREAESLAGQETKVREQMTDLDQRVARVESKLLNLRQREGKLWLIPDKSSTTKEAILAVVGGTGVKVLHFDHPDRVKDFAGASARSEFSSYLGEAKPLDEYFVFLVRPSGIGLFGSVVRLARDKGFEVGFDALEEDKDVYFSTPPVPDDTTPPASHTASQYQPGSGGYSDRRGGAGDTGGSGSGPGQRQANAGSGSAQQPGSSPGEAGSGGYGDKNSAGTSRTGGAAYKNAAQAGGADSGSGNGTGSGAVNGAGSGSGSGTGSDAGNGTSPNAGNGKGSGAGGPDGTRTTARKTDGSPSAATNSADGSDHKAATNSAAFTDPGKHPPAPAAKTTHPTPSKPKSWWQRFLAWVASWF